MSDLTDNIKIGRIVLSIFAGIYGIAFIIMLAYGIHFQNLYKATMDNLLDYYYMSVDDILRLDWAIDGDYVFHKGLIWSACLAAISALVCIPDKRTDKYSHHLVIYLAIAGSLRLITGIVGISISHKDIKIKYELSENFKHYVELEENRAIQIFMEEEHKCCGIDGPSDYNQFNVTQYPDTCYNKGILNLEGCPRRIIDLYSTALRNFGIVFICTGLYEGFGAIPAYYLHYFLHIPEATPV